MSPAAFALAALLSATVTDGATLADLAGQGPGSLDLDRIRLAIDSGGILDVDTGTVPPMYAPSFTVVFGGAVDPLGAVLDASEAHGVAPSVFGIVEQRFTATLQAGVTVVDGVRVEAELPVVLLQTGPESVPGIFGKNPIAPHGVDDLHVVTRVALATRKDAPADVALAIHATAPTAFPRHAYIGDGLPTLTPEVDASTSFGPVTLALDVGLLLRARSTFGSAVQGSERQGRFGASWALADLGVPVELEASVNGAALVFPEPLSAGNNPIEGLVGATVDVGDAEIFVAAGGAILPAPGTPSSRALAGLRF
jgi:hypothetical protein